MCTVTCSMVSVLAHSMMVVHTTHTSQSSSVTKCLSLASVERDSVTGDLSSCVRGFEPITPSCRLLCLMWPQTSALGVRHVQCPALSHVLGSMSGMHSFRATAQSIRLPLAQSLSARAPPSAQSVTSAARVCTSTTGALGFIIRHPRRSGSTDLGLSLDGNGTQGGDSKRRSVSSTSNKDITRVVSILTKLSLSKAQQARFLKSIVMDSFRFPAECDLIMKAKVATQASATQAKTMHDKDRLGLPHIHIWNAFPTVPKQHANDDTKVKLDEYIATLGPLGWRALNEEVKHVRVRKNFDKQFVTVEIAIVRGSSSSAVYEILRNYSKTIKEAVELPGTAPSGDLERKLQVWLGSIGSSGQMECVDLAKASHFFESISLMDFDTMKARCAAMGLHAAETEQGTALRMVGKLLGATSC